MRFVSDFINALYICIYLLFINTLRRHIYIYIYIYIYAKFENTIENGGQWTVRFSFPSS
jgi:hypothetical protein